MTFTSLLAFVSTAILARRKEPESDARADLKEQIEELKAEKTTLLQHLVTEQDLRIDATRRLLDAQAQLLLQAERFPAFYLGNPPAAQAMQTPEAMQAQVRMGVVQLEHAVRDPGHFGFCTCVPGRAAMFRRLPGMVDSLRDVLDGE